MLLYTLSFLCFLLIFLYLKIFLCLCLKPDSGPQGLCLPCCWHLGLKRLLNLCSGWEGIKWNSWLVIIKDPVELLTLVLTEWSGPLPSELLLWPPADPLCRFIWEAIPHIFKDSSTAKATSSQKFPLGCWTLEFLSQTTTIFLNFPVISGHSLAA